MYDKEKVIKEHEKLINFVINKLNLQRKRDELLDIGMIGFTRGLNSYDETKGKYSTFLYECIKNEILRYLDYEKRKGRDTEIISYNVNIKDSKNTQLLDMLGYDVKYDDDIYFNEIIQKIMIELAENFTIRQEEIFKYIYGIDGFPKLSYVEIAKIYHTSKQSIYDTHTRVLKRLRGKLRDLINDTKN